MKEEYEDGVAFEKVNWESEVKRDGYILYGSYPVPSLSGSAICYPEKPGQI